MELLFRCIAPTPSHPAVRVTARPFGRPNGIGGEVWTDYGSQSRGRRLNGFVGLSLDDRTILFLVILLDKTVSVG